MQEWRNWQTRRLQVPVVARSCGFKSHLLHYFFSFVTNTRGAYKVEGEAMDAAFEADSDPVAFFCCAIFLCTTEFFFARIWLKKAFCYDTILKI